LNALLPTIRSRCQKLGFSAPTPSQAFSWLKENIDGNIEQSLLEYAGASPLLALQFQEQPFYVEHKTILSALINTLKGKAGVIAVANQWSEYSLSSFIEWWHACLCDVLKLLAGAEIQHLRFQSLYAELEIFAGMLDEESLMSFMDELFLLRQQLNRGATFNQSLMLESLLLRWQSLSK
jgi:DNA polymerase III subunit delta'